MNSIDDGKRFRFLEYEKLKSEQIERIKQRDAFLNFNIIALALVATYASEDGQRTFAWLSIPWAATILGAAYVANDEKVSAISRYMRDIVSEFEPSYFPSREHSMRRSTRWAVLHR